MAAIYGEKRETAGQHWSRKKGMYKESCKEWNLEVISKAPWHRTFDERVIVVYMRVLFEWSGTIER